MRRTIWQQSKRSFLWAGFYLLLCAALVFVSMRWIDRGHGDLRYEVAIGLGFFVWRFTKNLADGLHVVFKHWKDPGAAGLAEFIVRMAGLVVGVTLILQAVGLTPKNLLLSGAITAAVFIIAARDPLSNLVSGIMLASSRPFMVGDYIELQGGGLAGNFRGKVKSLGLMYTFFEVGGRTTMMPNGLLSTSAITILGEHRAVDFRATLRPGVTPHDVESIIARTISIPLRDEVHIDLVEVTDLVTVQISATPEQNSDGAKLAKEILEAIGPLTTASESIGTAEFEAINATALLREINEQPQPTSVD